MASSKSEATIRIVLRRSSSLCRAWRRDGRHARLTPRPAALASQGHGRSTDGMQGAAMTGMTDTLAIEITDAPAEEDAAGVVAGLVAFNNATVGPSNRRAL